MASVSPASGSCPLHVSPLHVAARAPLPPAVRGFERLLVLALTRSSRQLGCSRPGPPSAALIPDRMWLRVHRGCFPLDTAPFPSRPVSFVFCSACVVTAALQPPPVTPRDVASVRPCCSPSWPRGLPCAVFRQPVGH